MTNEMIVLGASIQLMKDGVIGTTGRKITVVEEGGREVEYDEPETIHTYAAWRKLGYQVRKGEKAVAAVAIWKYAENRKKKGQPEDENAEEEPGRMFKKNAYFFSRSQVDAVAC